LDWITFVKRENVAKAEQILKRDELVSRQSITVKDASSLEIKKEGSFFLINGAEDGIAKAKELIKEFIEEINQELLSEAKEKIKQEEEAAASGFGGIFG